MNKLLKWGLIIFVAIIIIGSISGGGSDGSTNSNTQAAQEESKTYQVNEVISTDKLELTVISVEEKDEVGGQYVNEGASEGATLVVVNWKYKNASDKPVGSFSQPKVKLVDSSGTEYDWDLGKTGTYSIEQDLDNKILSDLNPGITVKDAKVFEVSKESYLKEGWRLKFTVGGKSYFVAI